MRPSSSSDPNAPYRAAIASLVDCNVFPDEHAEQADSANTTHPHSPFAELSPRRGSPSIPPSAITDAGPSSATSITIDTVLEYLREQGRVSNLVYRTINNRLNSSNLSAATLLTALKAAYDTHHPLWATLGVNEYERYELINRLDGIVSHCAGFNKGVKAAAQNSNNDPEQLIANLLHYVRNLKH